jgi:hypothetical protein
MENNMDKKTFEKEIEMCKELSKKNNGKCKWGECEKCGVVPLLYKLGEGKLYEDKDEIEKIKKSVLQ